MSVAKEATLADMERMSEETIEGLRIARDNLRDSLAEEKTRNAVKVRKSFDVQPKAADEFFFVPTDMIVVQRNTRKESGFEESEIASLADSIKTHGILQPLLVRKMEGQHGEMYALVLGERRLRAAKVAGLVYVPCRVLDIDAKDVMGCRDCEKKVKYLREEGLNERQVKKLFAMGRRDR